MTKHEGIRIVVPHILWITIVSGIPSPLLPIADFVVYEVLVKPILFAILLGFAGLDPLSVVVIMPALSGKMPKAKAHQFALTVLLLTVALGVLLSCSIGMGARYVSDALDQLPDTVYVALDFAIAIAAGTWFVRRVFLKSRPSGEKDKKRPKFLSFADKSMSLAGFLFTLWIMTDPVFWAVVGLAAKEESVLMRILCLTIWVLLSQLPLYALTIAMTFGAHEKLMERVRQFLDKNDRRERLRRITQGAISLFALVVAVYFLIEPIIFLVHGKWI